MGKTGQYTLDSVGYIFKAGGVYVYEIASMTLSMRQYETCLSLDHVRILIPISRSPRFASGILCPFGS